MKPTAHLALAFDGQCEAAFRFYERAFDGTVSFMLKWADSPMAAEVPAQWGGKVCHATLMLGGAEIAGSDPPPGRYERPRGFSLVLQVEEPDQAERIFATLAERGRIETPLEETFWARRFGAVVDQFGITWSINCEKPS
jgi:PhnB protein